MIDTYKSCISNIYIYTCIWNIILYMTELLYWTSLLASQENNNSLQASPTQAREVLPGGSLPGRNPSPTKINIGNNGNHVVFFKQNRGWMMTSSYRFFRNISANRVGNHYSLNPSGSGWGVGVEVQKTVGKIRQKTSHLCKIYKDYPPKKTSEFAPENGRRVEYDCFVEWGLSAHFQRRWLLVSGRVF